MIERISNWWSWIVCLGRGHDPAVLEVECCGEHAPLEIGKICWRCRKVWAAKDVS